jgi:hypothetical protein
MALLAEYALTPDVFDVTSYSSEEVCGLHLQTLKEVLLQEGLVRDLRDGEWMRHFGEAGRPWHLRGKELLKKLRTQKRLVPARAALTSIPATDGEWCNEAIASHGHLPLAGIVATDAVAAPHSGTPIVCSVSKLTSANWWVSRSPSVRLGRTLVAYETALDLVLRHANSLILVDPYIDPTDVHQYADLLRLLGKLQNRSIKPLVEIHRAAWYEPGNDKRPRVAEVVAALTPELSATARAAGISVDVFLWDDIHDRYLITDLVGISLPYGFATTRNPSAVTTWTRLGRADRDSVQRDFDPAQRSPRHRFKVS